MSSLFASCHADSATWNLSPASPLLKKTLGSKSSPAWDCSTVLRRLFSAFSARARRRVARRSWRRSWPRPPGLM